MVVIRGYTGLQPIARGGFSRIYEANQVDLGRKVAVKVLSVDRHEVIDRNAFSNECRAMGALSSHPNVVTVFDSGFTEEGHPFITMELCQTDLATRVRQAPNGYIEPTEVAAIGAGIADALDRAHSAGILHRDIKPQNVLFTEYGPVLSDFGIASVPGDPRSSHAWALSLHYAAPEVLDEEAYTPACDLYSLGATLYTALAGKRPFSVTGANEADQLKDRVRAQAPPAITAQPVPRVLESQVRGLMAKHPQDRPKSAAEAAERLRAIERQLSGSAAAAPLAKPSQPVPLRSTDQLDEPSEYTAAETTASKARAAARPTADFVEKSDRELRPLLARFGLVVVLIAIALAAYLFTRGPTECVGPNCGVAEPTGPAELPALAPPAPGEVTVTLDDGEYLITWTGSDQAERYRVDRADGGPSLNSEETSMTARLAQLGEPPCVRLVAITAAGRISDPSDLVCPSPTPTPAESEPISVAEGLGEIDGIDSFSGYLATMQGSSLDNLSGGPYTVFAPSDSAFLEAIETLEDDEEIRELARFHIIAGQAIAADEFVPGAPLNTQSRTVLRVRLDGSLPGDTAIVESIEVTNGIIHLIDRVMFPDPVEVEREDAVTELNQILVIDPVHFATASAEILPESEATLDRAAEILRSVPDGSLLEVAGHTDSDGDRDLNLALSEARVQSVLAYLVGLGVDPDILVPIGYGEDRPAVSPELTDADKARNRRIEFTDISGP